MKAGGRLQRALTGCCFMAAVAGGRQVVGWQAAVTVVLLPHKLLLLLKTTGQRWAGRLSAASISPWLMSRFLVPQHPEEKK